MLIISLSLIVLLGLIFGAIIYKDSKESLTGKYYTKRRIGFLKDEIVVEVKLNQTTFTRVATKEDLYVLRSKFKIGEI